MIASPNAPLAGVPEIELQGTTSINDVAFTSGGLKADGAVTVANGFDWSGGTLSGAGTVTVAAGSSSTLGNEAFGTFMQLYGALTIAGTAAVKTSTQLYLGSTEYDAENNVHIDHPATLTIAAGGTVTLEDQVTIGHTWNGLVESVIDNAGSLVKTGAGLSTIFDGIQLNNSGSLSVTEGALALDDLSSTGSVAVAAGAELRISGEASFAAGSSLDVDGLLQIDGGTTTIVTTPTLADVTVTSGSLVVETGVAIDELTLNGGQIELESGASVGSLFITGGTLITAGITVTENFAQTGGDLQLSAASVLDLTIGSGAATSVHWSDGADTIRGTSFSDTLYGEDGADRLEGGADDDTITGGSGIDTFVFGAASQGTDLIADFISGTDKIEVSAAGFGGGLVAGSLSADRLVVAAGHTSNELFGQFLYDTAEQALYWDDDGTGAAAPIKIATMVGLSLLSASDFVVS